MRLQAATAKAKTASTFPLPRGFALARRPGFLIQPKTSSMRFLMRWLIS